MVIIFIKLINQIVVVQNQFDIINILKIEYFIKLICIIDF